MQIVKLDPSFFADNGHLVEVMDRARGVWPVKTRGYGVVVIAIQGLTFAVPLRSNATHPKCYRYDGTKALDYSKALLIEDQSYIGPTFSISSEDYKAIRDKEHHFQETFTKYVESYIQNVMRGNASALRREYRFSTLQNYHAQLGLL